MHLAAQQQAGLPAEPDHDAVGQVRDVRAVAELAPGPVGALGVQRRVHLGGPRVPGQLPGGAPRLGEGEIVGAAAVPAGPVPGGKSRRLVEEEQRGPPARRHRVPLDAVELQEAADPQLRPPAADAEAAAPPVQAAAVAHHQATAVVRDDLAGRGHPVLQRHRRILR